MAFILVAKRSSTVGCILDLSMDSCDLLQPCFDTFADYFGCWRAIKTVAVFSNLSDKLECCFKCCFIALWCSFGDALLPEEMCIRNDDEMSENLLAACVAINCNEHFSVNCLLAGGLYGQS